jgi:sugar phosphate isomerase/epimerase
MQLGLFARTFARPTVEEVFDAVARLHLRCVQFNFSCAGLPGLPEAIPAELAERIRGAADERRIAIGALSGTFNMIHPNVRLRREGLRKLEVLAGACARLGARVVTLCTGTRDPENMWRAHADNGSSEAWRDLRVSLTKALTIANKHDLTLGIEPETGNVIDSADKARRLLDEMKSPRLKIIMDPANLFHPGDLPRQREILEGAFDLLGGDLVLAHAKELSADGHPAGLALGAGVLDWDLYLALLDRVGFSGPVILHGFEEADAASSVRFLRDKMASD